MRGRSFLWGPMAGPSRFTLKDGIHSANKKQKAARLKRRAGATKAKTTENYCPP